MADNELFLLDQYIATWHEEQDEPVPDDRAFEIIAATQVLRDYDVSADEIEGGVIGGGDDGAIDAVYTFLGGELLAEDSESLSDDFAPTKLPRGTDLSFILVQAKRTASFTETAVDLAASSTKRLLDLGTELDVHARLYSEAVRSQVGIFRTALRKFGGRHLNVTLDFYYVTRGSTSNINEKVTIKADELAEQFDDVLSRAKGRVTFLGARELWDRIDTLPSYTLELNCEEWTKGESNVALVSLRDYLAFLRDEQGNLRHHIFDWNVRDYQGNVAVNLEIRQTLEDPEAPDFWWLNNGVTILSSKVTVMGRKFTLDDVQVVNGLQTSQTIFHTLKDEPDNHFALDQKILIRILSTGQDTSTRDRVIRATNSQTTVTAASLRATDEIQRRIENFFLAEGWFYDRRKNYYRNQGKPPARIIGIPVLAQAVMAMGLGRPDTARARPSSLLKKDVDYNDVFDKELPLPVFLWLAKTQKRVDAFLLSEEADSSASERTNLRFHLAMLCVAVLHGERVYATRQLSGLATRDAHAGEELLLACLKKLRSALTEVASITSLAAMPTIVEFPAGAYSESKYPLVPLDRVSKGPDFLAHLRERVLPDLIREHAVSPLPPDRQDQVVADSDTATPQAEQH